MTNKPANRPALARKTTRASEKKRQDALTQGVAITVNGKRYSLVIGDVTAMEAKAFREQVGVPFMRVMQSEEDWDMDWVAGVVWLARRLNGERMLKYAEVAEEIGYDTEIDMTPQTDDEEGHDVIEGEVEDPEA